MPDLVKWQLEYKGKGLQVIGVTYPPEECTLAAKVRDYGRDLCIAKNC